MKKFLIGFVVLLAGCSSVSSESLSYVGDFPERRVYFESLEEMLAVLEGEIYLPKMDEGYFMGSVYQYDEGVLAADFNFKNGEDAFTYSVILAKDYDLEDVDATETEYYGERDDYVYGVYGMTGESQEVLKSVMDGAKLVEL